jgi:hypothetical protein
MAKCNSCRAEIRWVTSQGGKKMPIDAEPVSDGNLEIRDGVARVLTKAELSMLPDGPRYKSHFATCLNANAHRKD